jgi:hypothetical protein
MWSLRTHRCFRALQRAFAMGCQRFGYRLIEFSVQGNHMRGHDPPLVVEPWWWMLRVGAPRAMDRERELLLPLAA